MKAQKYICSAILALLSILSIVSAVFIARSAFGLPLDDAYIFLKYAENLSLDHGFSFNPGETSFGCTSFLWPVLVSLFLRFIAISHYTFLVQSLGIIFFGASVFLAGWIMRSLKAHPLFAAAAAVLTAASPVMFMNAVSGMETPLLILEVLILFMLLSRARPPMVLIGLLTGLIFLTRPEGLYFALAIPIAWLIKKWRDPDETVNSAVINPLLRFFAPFIILAIPYVAFVWKNTGSFLPTTYRGKIMAADPGLLDRPFLENLVHALLSLVDGWRRLLEPAGLVVGLTLILFAAALGIWILIRLAKKIETDPALLSLIVMLGFLLLPAAYGYAFRVHPAFGGYYNRYIACVLPCFAILGCLGMDRLYNLAADRIPFSRLYTLPGLLRKDLLSSVSLGTKNIPERGFT
jgi:hypothetical protein